MEVLDLPIVVPQNQQDRQRWFEEIYEKVFPSMARFVSHMGGNLEDAKDIFQDALVIFYEKQLENQWAFAQDERAYIVGISKHLWLCKFRKDAGKVYLDVWEQAIEIPEDYFPNPAEAKLLKLVEQAGKKCLEVLYAFYYEQQPLQEIAKIFGYLTVRSATVQKFKCLEKIREKVQEKSMNYEDFVA